MGDSLSSPGQDLRQTSRKSNTRLYVGIGIAAVVIIIIIVLIVVFMGGKSTPPPRPTTMSDCGYPDQPRGWYDINNRGYRNDFCRTVGNPGATIFSCNIDGKNVTVAYDAKKPFDPYTGTLTGWNCP